MTEIPERTVDLSRLRKANRRSTADGTPPIAVTPPLDAVARDDATPTPSFEPPAQTASPPQAKPRKATTIPASPARTKKSVSASNSDERKEKVTGYVRVDSFARSRAAFLATRSFEGDESWSAFVERALIAEAARREKAHNGGARYAGEAVRLQAGRPISS